MAAIAITRGRPNDKPGRKVFRGMGTWNSTDTTGTLQVPAGNVIGARFTPLGTTMVSIGITDTPTNGVIVRDASGNLNLKRSAGTDSGQNFLFEIEYDSQ